MRRLVASAFAVLVALVALWSARPAAPASAAAPAGTEELAVAEAQERDCAASLLPAGTPGAARRAYLPTVAGVVSARLRGPDRDDWDLATFDAATGRKLAASSGFTATELVPAAVAAGQAVVVQACRRSGPDGRVPLTLDFAAMPPATPGAGGPVTVARVPIGSPAELRRLEGLGLDVTENAKAGSVDVVLLSAAERARLAAAGFDGRTVVGDLAALDRRRAATDGAVSGRAQARALPSGRTTYRSYEDYGNDLKALVAANPGTVVPAALPGASLEGRPFEGVELAAGAGKPGDGRPIFLLGGLTHAREWPGGEASMEYAIDLAKRFKAREPRITALLAKVRVLVFPVLNPDGFVVSRQAGPAGGDDDPTGTSVAQALNDQGAYKRKNCRAVDPATQALPCMLHAPQGVDLNRAYGAYWGGPGTSANPSSQAYRGTAPFTEPEAQAVRAFGAAHQVQVFITNHTYTDVGRWLRQPGFKLDGDEVGDTTQDEAAMAALGQRMASATGYVSELGYATLGNITGPSDDHLYYSQGTYGYTPELRGSNFHTSYADAVVGEFEGEGAQAGEGLREAYTLAAETAADATQHVVLKGTAPPGRVLRLRRTTTLHTSEAADDEGTTRPRTDFAETADLTLVVPAGGTYEWHVNPSTRPIAPLRSEAFTFTCEQPGGGAVLQSAAVVADRGQTATTNFTCASGGATGSTTAPTTTTPTPAGSGSGAPGGGSPTAPGGSGTPGTGTSAKPTGSRRLVISRPSFSAKRTRRVGSLQVRLRLLGAGRLQSVTIRIEDARRRVLFTGKRSQLTGAANVRVRPKRRLALLRAGAVRVVVSASDGGRRVAIAKVSRVTR